MRKKMPVLLLAALFSVSGIAGAAEVYYVQSLKAKVMSDPSFRAKVLGDVAKGTRFAQAVRKGSWIRVPYKGELGYIPSMLLSPNKPMERVSLIKGEEADIKQSVRRRASTYTSAAAARGLTQDDRRRLSRDEKADYGGVEKMESFSVSEKDLEGFLGGKAL